MKKVCKFQLFFLFQHLLAYFHNFMVYPTFFLFRMLDGHLLHLISWKNLVLDMPFFLLQPLEYVYPHISQWTKTWKNITDKYLFRKWLDIIYRFVLTNSIPFIWEIRILIITAHCMCISTIPQCMHLHVQDVNQKYFWTWN